MAFINKTFNIAFIIQNQFNDNNENTSNKLFFKKNSVKIDNGYEIECLSKNGLMYYKDLINKKNHSGEV
jgi:hypothetical protein